MWHTVFIQLLSFAERKSLKEANSALKTILHGKKMSVTLQVIAACSYEFCQGRRVGVYALYLGNDRASCAAGLSMTKVER